MTRRRFIIAVRAGPSYTHRPSFRGSADDHLVHIRSDRDPARRMAVRSRTDRRTPAAQRGHRRAGRRDPRAVGRSGPGPGCPVGHPRRRRVRVRAAWDGRADPGRDRGDPRIDRDRRQRLRPGDRDRPIRSGMAADGRTDDRHRDPGRPGIDDRASLREALPAGQRPAGDSPRGRAEQPGSRSPRRCRPDPHRGRPDAGCRGSQADRRTADRRYRTDRRHDPAGSRARPCRAGGGPSGGSAAPSVADPGTRSRRRAERPGRVGRHPRRPAVHTVEPPAWSPPARARDRRLSDRPGGGQQRRPAQPRERGLDRCRGGRRLARDHGG